MNRSVRRFVLAGMAVAAAAALTVPVVAENFSKDDKAEIEAIVRSYILENPEIIRDAIMLLQLREREAQEAAMKEQIAAARDALMHDPESPVGGNPDGDVTLVEFFDYQCGYCKSVFPSVQQLLENDGNVRFVYKEFPILGPNSVLASRAALASREQGKYPEFHDALMAHRGALDEAVIFRIAESVELDVARLRKDMDSDAINKAIATNVALAQSLGINGTPAFVVGDELVPGAIGLADLQQLVAQERAK